MPTVAEVVEALNDIAPLHLAADWDNVGLLLGDAKGSAAKIMTCLTMTPESAGEAVEQGANLIVSHHPIFFRATKSVTTAASEGRMLWSLARAGVAVYSPHTAFDNARGGINDLLASRFGLGDVKPLRLGGAPGQVKIVVFVPDADLNRVADAMFAAGAGRIGQYRECSFRLAGTGTFFGSEAAHPTVGQKGRREEVSEWRLEAVCPETHVDRVVVALKRSHSYEEPAYDVYPLRPERREGVGRVGVIAEPTTLEKFAHIVKEQLAATSIQMVGEGSRTVQRVAIVCGAGGDMVKDAVSAGAEVFVTGEARFHDCLAAQSHGLALVLPGHYATERPGVEDLAGRIGRRFLDAHVWASRRESDPVRLESR